MELGHLPKETITPQKIQALFSTNPNLTSEVERIQWIRYLNKYESICAERVRRFDSMFTAFENIRRWGNTPLLSEFYQHYVMSSMYMFRILGIDVNENYAMEMYLNSFLVILNTQIAFSEEYMEIEYILRRKKLAYGLEIRSVNNTDIPIYERFTRDDVQDCLNSLILDNQIFYTSFLDFNEIKAEKAGLKDIASKCVVRACDMITGCYNRIKIKHTEEIRYYQRLYYNHIIVD